jgi:hypothetical protein
MRDMRTASEEIEDAKRWNEDVKPWISGRGAQARYETLAGGR